MGPSAPLLRRVLPLSSANGPAIRAGVNTTDAGRQRRRALARIGLGDGGELIITERRARHLLNPNRRIETPAAPKTPATIARPVTTIVDVSSAKSASRAFLAGYAVCRIGTPLR